MRLFTREPIATPRRPDEGGAPGIMIGRQPIFDRHRTVFGYELLFRAVDVDAAEMRGEDTVAALINEAVMTVGLERLTGAARAFIELPPPFLTHDVVHVLPASRVILQIPCDKDLTDATVEACRRLRETGYQLALTRFTSNDHAFSLLPLASFVKTDFLSVDAKYAQAAIAARQTFARPALVATKVEAGEIFAAAVRDGFSHVQGFFFERPAAATLKPLPRGHVGALRLLQAVNDPHLSLGELEDLVKHDASLCYRLLQTVNSAAYAQTIEVTSIRHALLLAGRNMIRRWASLWIMAGLGTDQHRELVLMASIRGRLCELLMARQAGPESESEAFLLGMCSCLGAILEQPMSVVLEALPLSRHATAALLGQENPLRNLLDCVMAYERGDWDMCLRLADVAGIEAAWLPAAQADALGWAQQIGGRGRMATG